MKRTSSLRVSNMQGCCAAHISRSNSVANNFCKKALVPLLLGIFFFGFVPSLEAKDTTAKFGKVSVDEFGAKRCPIDSNAHAYYMFDKGSAEISFLNDMKIEYKRHLRIKIVDQGGFDEATIILPYYERGTQREEISAIKGYTYNLVNGKVEKTSLGKAAIFNENVSKNYYHIKITFPEVKEGSIIELSYNMSSNLFSNMPEWRFQHGIPVLKSTYSVEIPEYFHYNQFQRGYLSISTQMSTNNRSFPGTTQSYQTNIYDYDLEDVPAFPVGEQLTTIDNYITKVDYELASFNVPGKVYESYSNKWEDVVKIFIEDEDFGQRLKGDDHLKALSSEIQQKNTSPQMQMKLAFEAIKSKMKWNGNNGVFCTSALRKTFENGNGNPTDVNLNLVALLKRLGLEAYPVVLSTRSNGMIHPAHPSINQMNYTVVLCIVNETSYLMDATERYSDIDVLPARCLNGSGLIISSARIMWEPLLKGKLLKSTMLYDLSLDENGEMKGRINMLSSDFKAMETRSSLNKYETVEKYLEMVEENNKGLHIQDCTVENADSIGKDLVLKMDVAIKNCTDRADDLMFFAPMLFEAYKKNPFSLEKREYPIEYPYPIYERVVISVNIPEGYQVESIPQSVVFAAIDGKCKFSFRTAAQGNKLTILSTLEINQTLIPGDRYQEIKGMFEKVVEKHTEKVVLKKI